MKISVIVPVYNVEPYLKQSLDSIINQDYRNLEIILINDGSTDNSGEICDNYAQIDNRITVIHQPNSGPAASRNKGLQLVSGDYISFIDSDDWINQGMYSTMIHYLTEDNSIDVIYMPYPASKKNTIPQKYNNIEIREKILQYFIGKNKISLGRMAAVWTLLIRKNVVEGLAFPYISYCEDKLYFIETILRSNILLRIPYQFYNYRYNSNSITHKYYKTYAEDLTEANKAIRKLMIQYNINNKKMINLQNNTIICFYHHLIKNESRNNQLTIPNKALNLYYTKNDLDKLLTWTKILHDFFNKPSLILIKLGFSSYLLKRKWNRYHKS